ncbi:hypothetical protein J4E91_010133 [Alternaria rosae]|nr:hypothetical protein J4E91_010133 [Alternaria rosae]
MNHESSEEGSISRPTSQASGPDAEPAHVFFEDGGELSNVSDNLIPDSEDVSWDVITTKLSEARKNDTESDASTESRLGRLFPDTLSQAKSMHFTENDIQQITTLLQRCSRDTWSRIPRIYAVLRMIGQLDAIEKFIEEEITDIWFPFRKHSLEKLLTKKTAQTVFLEVQVVVFNTQALTALSLERGEASHGHFSNQSDIPLKSIGILYTTSSAVIERVSSAITQKEYALKTIRRPSHFRNDQEIMRVFEMELRVLKRVTLVPGKWP